MAVAPPSPRLPSLSRLHAVALTQRHGGYAAAAQIMGLSAGALRARVRAVEAALGVTLATAAPHGLVMTATGERLGAQLAQGFDGLAQVLAVLAPPPLPLSTLIPLEAALRFGGFAAAAQDLGVTPSAVSEQVAVFETWARRPLFRRHPRGVTPTPEALALHPSLSAALDTIRDAVRGIARDPVRIAALPAVAQLWLAPRLPALRASLPGVTVAVTALEHPPDAKRAPYDLAVFPRLSGGIVLAKDSLLPVCTPAIAARMASPRDLAALPCLGDAVWSGDWALWARATGIAPPPAILHSLYALAVDEALAGAGVLMGHRVLVQRHLETGRLVAPFEQEVALPRSLRLTHSQPLRPDAARVAKWLEQVGS